MDLDSLIEKICNSKETYSLETLNKISNQVISILIQENNVLELEDPIRIVGDVHGQFYDLMGVFNGDKNIEKPFKTLGHSKYLFLGDYIDRGNYGIKTITLLLLLKIKFPHDIFLLRGNHETRAINKEYGFYEECLNFFQQESQSWKIFNNIFDHLPIVAIVNNYYFCVHAGISPNLTLFDIKRINRFVETPITGTFSNLIWSDPEENIDFWKESKRGSGLLYGKIAAENFLEVTGLKMIIRSHQLVESGTKITNNTTITIWSAPNYCYTSNNRAKIIKIGKKGLTYIEVLPSHEDKGHNNHFNQNY
ncbi:serine/threonine-protein phosphatase 6 catalytic subunit [Anaeramoeba flamelloides]|uniref:Serine/threonine-protein phosphatase n=1 Tax=Anaeramoeba flamelloides TaxID=1746091 RepID=A0ABQ8X6W0_9EUKA|nr:serine/threonine-protein phosphatase 6 catalytic subunit [Anaeramoeba flamelloides]